ncbi:MAG: spermidine/putrescine ABC transporter substrate-binding protein [Gammaproteobacteria bacterium]|nr:spermidine/putrescine ABC transporter substrate-binding protein [Gammaproteobacteria bacterium]
MRLIPTFVITTSTFVLSCAMMTAVQAAGELNVYNWGDYINPEVLTRFEQEHDVKVTLDTYGTNEEMLAKIQAGATGYDIVFPSVHMHDIMHKLDLLWESNINKSSGFENIEPDFIRANTDPESSWCLPYAWGTVGIVYNKTKVPEITSWEDFFAIPDKYGEKITMLDDLRETIGVGLIMNGHSVNSRDPEELKAAQQFILDRKDKISAFTYDVIPLVQSGDVAASHWYVGAMYTVLQNPDEMGYVIPKEGATMYQEDICVLKTAPNKENAKLFMEFYLQPEMPALNVEQQMNGTPNKAARALLPDNLRNNPGMNPPPDVMAKLQIFEDLGADLKKYDRVWTKIRTQ